VIPHVAAEPDSPLNKRLALRSSTLKRAQIIFGASAIDCVVVDTSSGGLRVRTASIVTVPEWVTLRYPDGSMSRARRRWMRGTQIGFQLIGSDSGDLLEAMIAGLTHDQRRALITKLEASLIAS
jgi:hypothetical protein